VLKGLRAAFDERDTGRIAREIARLSAHGLDPLAAARRAIEWSHDRLEYGSRHAYAATSDWLTLHDELMGRWDAQLTCLTEAVDHMADESLRHPVFPYPADGEPFDGAAFGRAIEEERHEAAEGMVLRGVSEGLGWDALEPSFAAAALAHYNDFGHAAIYVHKTGELARRLGADTVRWLAPALARHLAFATREDLLPDFKGYAEALATMPEPAEDGDGTRPDAGELFGAGAGKCMRWTAIQASRCGRAALFDALLEASARNLLHYDMTYQSDSHRPVSQNAGWLNLTHAVTFANAVGALCARHPSLGRAGLLQMACFVGRNAGFVDRELDTGPWRVDDEPRFFEDVREQLLDHGLLEPIYSCHLLKTARAVQTECVTAGPSCRAALLAALNRFLHSPIKQKHALRNARQAIALVQRDFA
jgi:hypothetical protein